MNSEKMTLTPKRENSFDNFTVKNLLGCVFDMSKLVLILWPKVQMHLVPKSDKNLAEYGDAQDVSRSGHVRKTDVSWTRFTEVPKEIPYQPKFTSANFSWSGSPLVHSERVWKVCEVSLTPSGKKGQRAAQKQLVASGPLKN